MKLLTEHLWFEVPMQRLTTRILATQRTEQPGSTASDWGRKMLKIPMGELPRKVGRSPFQKTLHSGASQIIALFFCILPVIVRAAVTVSPQRVEESRALIFKDDKVSRAPASLKVVLAMDGPEAEAATQYGHVKLDEVNDSTGASLIPRYDSFHDPARFREYANAFFRNSKFRETEIAKPQVELDLALPSRAAARIVHLRGSLELSDGGKTNTVEFGGLKRAGKRAVPMPNGCSAAVTILIPEGENVRSISLESTGDESALASIEVVDATGKSVSSGMSRWSLNGGPEQKSLSLSKALDDSMKLVVKVISDRKFTKVNFDLKDIPLP